MPDRFLPPSVRHTQKHATAAPDLFESLTDELDALPSSMLTTSRAMPVKRRSPKSFPLLQRQSGVLRSSLVTAVILSTIAAVWVGTSVPVAAVWQAVRDPHARQLYLNGEGERLYGYLYASGVANKLDEFYRDRIPDPVERDLFVRKVMIDATIASDSDASH